MKACYGFDNEQNKEASSVRDVYELERKIIEIEKFLLQAVQYHKDHSSGHPYEKWNHLKGMHAMQNGLSPSPNMN